MTAEEGGRRQKRGVPVIVSFVGQELKAALSHVPFFLSSSSPSPPG
jgi:hypothetical protein